MHANIKVIARLCQPQPLSAILREAEEPVTSLAMDNFLVFSSSFFFPFKNILIKLKFYQFFKI